MYALNSARRGRQIAGDLAVIAWCAVWTWVATVVHALVMRLAEPAQALQKAATDFGTTMTDAGTTVSKVPVAGDDLQGIFGRFATVGADATAAGVEFESGVAKLALVLALVTALAPSFGVLGPWVASRVRFARRAAAARRFVDAEADLDLFALRAMAGQPLPRLAAISADPVTAWRSGDKEVIRALATLELKSIGLRPVLRGGHVEAR